MALRDDTTLANWLSRPFERRSFQRVREIVPTARIGNDTGVTRPLDRDPRALDGIRFRAADGTATTLDEHLARTWAEGLCVLKDGRIACERYLNGMDERTPHLLMSVSKSWCGALLGVQVGRGLVARDTPVGDVVPDMAGTSLDGATVADLIDMTAGTAFVEDYDLYDDPAAADSPLLEYERQAGYRPLGAREPIGVLAHFRTYPTAGPHGTAFDYRSPLTNIAAHVIEAVTGLRYPDALARDLWGPLGQEFDADIMLDPRGFPVVEGGMSCALRDLARLGQAYLDGGLVDNRQVVPAAWVRDTFDGDPTGRAQWEASATLDADMRGAWSMYRNAFWVRRPGAAISGIGIHGQFCYVDRDAGVVIARLSTFPQAFPADVEAELLRSFDAIVEALS